MKKTGVLTLLFLSCVVVFPVAHAQKTGTIRSEKQNLAATAGAARQNATRTPTSQAPEPPPQKFWLIAGAVVAAVLMVLAVLAFVLAMRSYEKRVVASMAGIKESLAGVKEAVGRDRAREKETREDLEDLKSQLRSHDESIHAAVRRIFTEMEQAIARAPAQSRRPHDTGAPAHSPSAAPVLRHNNHDDLQRGEDHVAQLLSIANRIVQQSSTTLDAFCASTGSFAAHVSVWPNAREGAPVAFIVEHRGTYYAIPNVVKPARLPQEWFNRSEFGVNDEIQRVISLPRLTRRGDQYDVQVPGVFAR